MRILPHHQDTGGFFVAVIEKVKLLPWEKEIPQPKEAVSEKSSSQEGELSVEKDSQASESDKRPREDEKKSWGPQRKRRRVQGYKEDPFVFFKDETEDVWSSIKWEFIWFFLYLLFFRNNLGFFFFYYFRQYYNISDKLDPKCLLVRCHEGKKKNIYFTSPAIREIVICNEDKVKMINTGIKTFVRCDNKNMKCPFRLAQEGVKSISHVIGENRKMNITKGDMILLLQNNDPHSPPEISKLCPETQERLKSFGTKNII